MLTRLFTPARPTLGRYEACTTPDPLASVADATWAVEQIEPLDAFGRAGAYDRAALSRLYGGMRPRVARGWIDAADRFEAQTLISPYPDATLSRLQQGTLVIRLILPPRGKPSSNLDRDVAFHVVDRHDRIAGT